MVCPNCKSKDIITVQDQKFCINCGQILPSSATAKPAVSEPAPDTVAEPAPEPTAAVSSVKVAETAEAGPVPAQVAAQAATPVPTPIPVAAPAPIAVAAVAHTVAARRKRKPGRPKAGRLDVLQPVEMVSGPKVTDDLGGEVAPTPIASAGPDIPATVPEAVISITTQPVPDAPIATPAKISAPRIAPHHGRRISDISSRRHDVTANPETSQTPTQSDAAPQQEPQQPQPSINHPNLVHERHAAAVFGMVESASLRERFRPVSFGLAILPATLLAVIVGAVTYIAVAPNARLAWSNTLDAGWPLWGELIAVAVLYYLSRMISGSAISYGASRLTDHRPTPRHHQISAAINSFHRRLGFDIAITVAQLGLAGLIAAVVMAGGAIWPVPEAVQAVALFAVYLVMAYLLAGLGLVKGLGHVALTIGKISPWRAFKTCWSLYRHNFEMVGFKFLALIVEAILTVPLLAAIIALVIYLPRNLSWLAAAMAVVLAAAGGSFNGAGAAIWWQMAYRVLVKASRPQEATKLLTGRQPQHTHRGSAAFVLTLLLIAATTAIIWPYVISH